VNVADVLEPLRDAYVEGACDYVIGRPLVDGQPVLPAICHGRVQAWALGWRDAEATFPRERLFGVRQDLEALAGRGTVGRVTTTQVVDLEQYRRAKVRGLERRVAFLESERARLERLLATALRTATGGTNVEPLALLDVLEERSVATLGTATPLLRCGSTPASWTRHSGLGSSLRRFHVAQVATG
jgi:hypothetical protein